MMKIRYCLYSLLLLTVFVSCKNKSNEVARLKADKTPTDSIDLGAYPCISISEEVDMGIFTSEEMKKTVDIKVDNIGGEPLRIVQVVPDCECTVITMDDSIVAPYASSLLHASLDLTGYPADTISKRFGLISNSVKNRVMDITLNAVVK